MFFENGSSNIQDSDIFRKNSNVCSIRIYILLNLFYIRRAISTQTNPKSGLGEKKHAIYSYSSKYVFKLNKLPKYYSDCHKQ